MAKADAPKKAKARVIDMAKAGERSNFRTQRMPRGPYKGKITGVVENTSKAGNDQWVFSIDLVHPTYRRTFPYNCQFDENMLWKIRNLLTAAGLKVPKSKVNVDPNRLVGRHVGLEIDDDEYDGKERSTIIDVFPVSELAERQESSVEDEDDEDVEEEEEEEEPEPPRKAKKKAAPPPPDEDEEEEEEEEDEDEEEEPAPPPKKRKAKKPVEDVDDDDLEELDLDDLE